METVQRSASRVHVLDLRLGDAWESCPTMAKRADTVCKMNKRHELTDYDSASALMIILNWSNCKATENPHEAMQGSPMAELFIALHH